MNNVTVCVFPETVPSEELLFPLVQVFGRIVYLQAVENEPLAAELSTPFIKQLLQQGILQPFTPIPLGEERERFLALTGDMKKRGGDYLSQLSMLTLAGMNRGGRTESKNTILTRLLQSGAIDSSKEEELLLLWQSRLMLKLGEFYDAEQAELNRALRDIAGRQDDLLAELREESDNPFSLTDNLPESDQQTDTILQHRLKAWSRLFFHGMPSIQPQLFISGHEAAIDFLQEGFEKNHQQSARKIASLELPLKRDPLTEGSSPAPLIHQCPELQAALARLAATDTFTPSQVEELSKRFTEEAPDWSNYVSARYPASQYGRCRLDLILFPGISPQQLFLEGFGGNPSMDAKGHTPCSGAFIGLLKRKSDWA